MTVNRAPTTGLVVGYIWPGGSLRPERMLDQLRGRIRKACGDDKLRVEADEGTPSPAVGPRLKRLLTRLGAGSISELVVAVDRGPVVTLRADSFEIDIGPLSAHPLVKLGLVDTWKRVSKRRPTTTSPGGWRRRTKVGPANADAAPSEPPHARPAPVVSPAITETARREREASEQDTRQEPLSPAHWETFEADEPPSDNPLSDELLSGARAPLAVVEPAPRRAPVFPDPNEAQESPPLWLIAGVICALGALAFFLLN